ncbi:M23 family metallopeptidase [Geobacter pickeringii]|uniref:Peptidase M23 n=1 Tax=Geobacter pickeringii TaxID=345632 RepID=A0A0B5B9H9_9BACT|nr:M23 family metallopeptidase [Geobacter pickeringii]AJE03222.1 peptidase M23 [Geobacter pickeringii]
MRFLLALLITLSLALPAHAGICDDWDLLEKKVRDGAIGKEAAREEIVGLHGRLLATYRDGDARPAPLVFPVQGYGPRAIGGRRGNGYQPAGYRFYDGNRHGGHPAHDIFIRDRNQDGRDDATGEPVSIVSASAGVVVATNPQWERPSRIRGGKYVWVLDPATERYYYYAHLAEVKVAPGQRVEAGTVVGILGRTGRNAYPRRSPTHLHFMCLDFDGGRMTPRNTYRELLPALH